MSSLPVFRWLIFAACLNMSAAAAYGDMLQVGPGEYVLKNQVEVEFARGVDVGPITTVAGVPHTGLASFDRLSRLYNVVSIEPMFPGADPAYVVDLSRFYVITFAEDRPDVLALVGRFAGDAAVERAHPHYIREVDFIPNDRWFVIQWALKHVDDHDVDADTAWDINKGNPNLAVAVADTGVDWEHQDLGGNIWYNLSEKNGRANVDDDGNGYVDDDKGWDWVTGVNGVPGEDLNIPDNDPMDFHGHGTHCAGIASAVTNNGEGVAGVGFKTKVMSLRIGWAGYNSRQQEVGYVSMSWAAQAMRYAADKGAVAFNCSWGSSNSGGLGAAVDFALSKGMLICSAAGNNNNMVASYLSSRSEVIAVAATDVYGKKASFSSYGDWVDVSAPGVQIYSTYRYHLGPHSYGSLSGTSMSCPHVVGLAALVRTKYPDWRWSKIRTKIVSTCDNIDGLNPSYVGKLGSGIINCRRALSDPGVELTLFTARPRRDGVAVRWETAVESNHAGFNLYRRTKGAGEYERLNANLIEGRSPYNFFDDEAEAGSVLEYLLEDVDLGGTGTRHGPVECELPGGAKAATYSFSRPSPNPARTAVNVTYALPAFHRGDVEIVIYDVSGRRVATAEGMPSAPGEHDVSLDVSSFAPGVYVCQFNAGSFAAAKKVVVIR